MLCGPSAAITVTVEVSLSWPISTWYGSQGLCSSFSAAQKVNLAGVPAVAETPGLDGFDIASWMGMFGPAGMPRPVVNLLSSEMQKIAAKEENKERFVQLSAELKASTPEELGEIVTTQYDNWGRRIKEAGIQPE